MLTMLDVPLTEAVYTFVDGRTGEPLHIAASTLGAALRRAGAVPQMALMHGTLIKALEENRLNVEEHHALKLPDAALDVPCIVGEYGDTHIIIDGTHRLWRRWKRGDTEFPVYYVPEIAWRHFLIDMPGDGAFWEQHNRTAKVRP